MPALILGDDQLAAIGVALRLLERRYRIDRLPVPASVKATIAALERHGKTSVDAPAAVPDPEPVPRHLVTFDEAAERLSCSRRTVDRMAADGRLATVTIGARGRRIPITALDQLGKS